MAAASGPGLGGVLETDGDVEVAARYGGCVADASPRRLSLSAPAGIVTIDSRHGR